MHRGFWSAHSALFCGHHGVRVSSCGPCLEEVTEAEPPTVLTPRGLGARPVATSSERSVIRPWQYPTTLLLCSGGASPSRKVFLPPPSQGSLKAGKQVAAGAEGRHYPYSIDKRGVNTRAGPVPCQREVGWDLRLAPGPSSLQLQGASFCYWASRWR